MTNKIRWRVWDGKRMWYPEDGQYYINQNGAVFYDTQFTYYPTLEQHEVTDPTHQDADWASHLIVTDVAMLSTGCFDKDGKEIYVGDYMGFINPKSKDGCERVIGPVIFEKAQFKLQLKHLSACISDWDKGKVIGNMYENPELMERKRND